MADQIRKITLLEHDGSDWGITLHPETSADQIVVDFDKQFISTEELDKLAGIEEGANLYVHPTGDGNLHVPATGTVSDGKILKAGATAGDIDWGNLTPEDIVGLLTGGVLDTKYLPALSIVDVFEVDTETEMLALDAQQGDLAIMATGLVFILKTSPASVRANWVQINIPTGAILTINGKSGTSVTLTADDVGAATVLHTHDVTDIGGILPILNGGTGTNALPTGLLIGNGTNALVAAVPGTDYVEPEGNVATASALETARDITVTGTVSGTASFDGSENVNIATTRNFPLVFVSDTAPVGARLGDMWVKPS